MYSLKCAFLKTLGQQAISLVLQFWDGDETNLTLVDFCWADGNPCFSPLTIFWCVSLFYSQVGRDKLSLHKPDKGFSLQSSRGAGSSRQAIEYNYNNKSKSKKQFPTWSQNWLYPCNRCSGNIQARGIPRSGGTGGVVVYWLVLQQVASVAGFSAGPTELSLVHHIGVGMQSVKMEGPGGNLPGIKPDCSRPWKQIPKHGW